MDAPLGSVIFSDDSVTSARKKHRRSKDEAAAHRRFREDASERLGILLDMYFVPVASDMKLPSKVLQDDVVVSQSYRVAARRSLS